jgi:two-component sensor histidine kinase
VSELSRGRGVEDRVAALEQAVASRTRDLRTALDRQTALLHELDHRVKNNLQLISSLVLMQARRAEVPPVREALTGMHERLTAMGVAHRRLFQSEDVGRFDLSEFVRDLVGELRGPAGRPDVAFFCDLAPVMAPSAQAAPLALLLNELLTNALRHGFPVGRGGTVTIKVTESAQRLWIEIADDGVGEFPDGDAAGDGCEQGFGLTIVELLGRQLQAEISRESAEPGVRVRISLPLEATETTHDR